MQCQLLYFFIFIAATHSSDYDYAADSTEDSLACEDESEIVCNLINRLIKGTPHKSIGMQLRDTVEKQQLACARSVENQRKEFTKKSGIVREASRVMIDTVNTLRSREKNLELEIESKQKEAAELRNTLNNLNSAANDQNAQVLAEKRRLEAELAIARRRILELETDLGKVKRQRINIEKQVTNLSDLNKSLVTQNFELLNQTATACTMHVKTITDLETQLENLKQQQDLARDTYNTKLDKLEIDVKKCGVENENTNFNLEQCKNGEDILNLQFQNLTNEIQKTKIALDSVKSECKRNEGKFEETAPVPNTMIPTPGTFKLLTGTYFFNKENLDWTSAQKHCQSLGMDLVAIETEAENEAISNHVKAMVTGRYQGAWTSGCYSEQDGGVIWRSTGQKVNNWRKAENHFNNRSRARCIVVDVVHKNWLSRSIYWKRPSICEQK